MPELPEIELYVGALKDRVVGRPLEKVRLRSASLLRTYDPPISAVEGKQILEVRRMGKRLVFKLEDDLFLVLHLMISGRLKWRKRGAEVPRKGAHGAFDFPGGTLLLTEAATQKRASLHAVRGEQAVAALNPGGLEVLDSAPGELATVLRREGHTIKRALTDPRIVSGIGNAHSDEILHAAKLSPFTRTKDLSDAEIAHLHRVILASLHEWIDRLREELGSGFPEKVSAFHPRMNVHGRFNQPCPVCGSPIQRIVHGAHETNYCPGCQTEGRILKDRALSRLLGDDWPKTLEELEAR